jgi:hypothetical protein
MRETTSPSYMAMSREKGTFAPLTPFGSLDFPTPLLSTSPKYRQRSRLRYPGAARGPEWMPANAQHPRRTHRGGLTAA